jgi:hypothetical protein
MTTTSQAQSLVGAQVLDHLASKADLDAFEHRLVVKLGGLLVVVVTVATAILGLLITAGTR